MQDTVETYYTNKSYTIRDYNFFFKFQLQGKGRAFMKKI